ncbi:MAG: NAD(P)-dependent oxidoreductase [Verrucomicrobiales bacterium]|nr:NAD(P)-dependent oxidoreductase [Verrucomicrobiales bacterium]MCP5527011.1 NAD(P)-dependent oxidoreductase [Verrucomicrobiales bacterium]
MTVWSAPMLPARFENEAALDDFLSQPAPAVVALMRRLPGDLAILGAAGKMGISLAIQAVRAVREAGVTKRVVAVARFSNPAARRALEDAGVETLACDLLEAAAVAGLPRLANVVFMAGRKFGTGGDAPLTWAANTLLPANVATHFRESRIVAFSTGCVYPLVAPDSGGCTEDEAPEPVGEYAQSCLGRERMFEYASGRWGTPLCLLRLNYAIDLRYGVLHDLASMILRDAPVDLGMGWFNCLWQGDANARALLALEHCAAPRTILNLTGPEILSVRDVARRLGNALDRPVRFNGAEHPTAWLNNATQSLRLFGPPAVAVERLIAWTADWLRTGGRSLGLPTHFEVRDGRF